MPLFPWVFILQRALAQDGVGDVFVNAEAGGVVFIDGHATGIPTPGMLQGVPAGSHTIRVDKGCLTGTADVAVRVNAIERVELKLSPGNGTWALSGQPHGAEVREGASLLGTTPLGPITTTCGAHTLTISAPGHQTVTQTAQVPLRGHVDLSVQLLKVAVGGVAVTVSPIDAAVWLDGQPRGTGPMTLDALPVGVHRLEVRADGYVTAKQEVTVSPEQIVRVAVALEKPPPPVPVGKRLGLDRVPWGRVALDVIATGAAGTLGWVAYDQYAIAVNNYGVYTGMTYADAPDAYYEDNVAAPRTRSYLFGAGAGVALAGAGVLWATTRIEPPAAPAIPPATLPAGPPPAAPTNGLTSTPAP
ncbi:MAG: PEGA domain-containing protein [Myxococcota bacterium]